MADTLGRTAGAPGTQDERPLTQAVLQLVAHTLGLELPPSEKTSFIATGSSRHVSSGRRIQSRSMSPRLQALRAVMHEKGEEYVPAQAAVRVDAEKARAHTQIQEFESKLQSSALKTDRGSAWSRDIPTLERELARVIPGEHSALLTEAGLLHFFTHLRVSNMKITTIDPRAALLSRLEELNISGNKLQAVTWLPRSLRALHAYGNEIDTFAPSDPLPALAHLGLGYNRITQLPELAVYAPALVSLDVTANHLCSVGQLSRAIDGLEGLQHLFVAQNPCMLTDNACLALYRHCLSLVSFDGHTITDDERTRLRSTCGSLPTIAGEDAVLRVTIGQVRGLMTAAAVYQTLGWPETGPPLPSNSPLDMGGDATRPSTTSTTRGKQAVPPAKAAPAASSAASMKSGAAKSSAPSVETSRRSSAATGHQEAPGDEHADSAVSHLAVGPEYAVRVRLARTCNHVTPWHPLVGSRPGSAAAGACAQTEDDDATASKSSKAAKASFAKELKSPTAAKQAPKRPEPGKRSPRASDAGLTETSNLPIAANLDFRDTAELRFPCTVDALDGIRYDVVTIELLEASPAPASMDEGRSGREEVVLASGAIGIPELAASHLMSADVATASVVKLRFSALPQNIVRAVERCIEACESGVTVAPVEASAPPAAKSAPAGKAAAPAPPFEPKPEPRLLTAADLPGVLQEFLSTITAEVDMKTSRLVSSALGIAIPKPQAA